MNVLAGARSRGALVAAWCRSTVAGLLPAARRRWRRSLQLRVVVSTLLLSAFVVVFVAEVLVSRVVGGIVSTKQRTAVAEATASVAAAQSAAARATTPGEVAGVINGLASGIASRSVGPGEAVDLMILPVSGVGYGLVVPDNVRETSVPGAVRIAVDRARGQEVTSYTTMRYQGAPSEPALVVGVSLSFSTGASYHLFYLFPLRAEAQTISLVRRTVAFAGAALVLLLVGIAGLVTRQVLTPLRVAARSAERLAAGRLRERMAVRGEDDLARLATSFNRMARNLQRHIEQLEELSRLQRRFVSDVSHELRTPLTTVRMAADVLHDERARFPPAVARSAELLQTELDRFESLLSDLLEISRYDAGAAVLESEPVDVCALVDRSVADTAALATRRGSELVVHAPPGPCVAEVDPRRVGRVLRNLLVNAVEHGEGRPVVVTLGLDDRAVAVVVEDHGVGLCVEEAEHVFERFWRADPARSRATGGTGLGLSIALEDAHLHGGWLQAWGAPSKGARFRLTLPRRAGETLGGSPLPLQPDPEPLALPPAVPPPHPAPVPHG